MYRLTATQHSESSAGDFFHLINDYFTINYELFFREKAPVGGISVKDHFEINLVPLTLGFTHTFLTKILAFCFPEKANNPETGNEEQLSAKEKKKKTHAKGRKNTSSNFYVESPLNQDDVEEMKVRAQQNKLFVYIKIPEVPLNLSYKGVKEKNKILDVGNFLLQVPTIEYHNVTWTWLDLSLAVKNQVGWASHLLHKSC